MPAGPKGQKRPADVSSRAVIEWQRVTDLTVDISSAPVFDACR